MFQLSKAKRSIRLIRCRMWAFVVLSRIKALENSLLQIILSVNFHSKTEYEIKYNQIWEFWELAQLGLCAVSRQYLEEVKDQKIVCARPDPSSPLSFLPFPRYLTIRVVIYLVIHCNQYVLSFCYASDCVNKLDQTLPSCNLQSSGRIRWKKY